MQLIQLVTVVPVFLMGLIGVNETDPAALGHLDVVSQLQLIHQFNERGQLEQARILLDQLRPAVEQQNGEQAIEFFLAEAHNLGLRGEYERGRQRLDQLLGQALSPLERVRALTLAANISTLTGDHGDAFGFLRLALPLEAEIDHPRHQSNLLSNAAAMFALAGEPEQAMELGFRSVDLADRSDSLRAQCSARQRLASISRFNSNFSDQAQKLNDAIDRCRQAGDPIFLASLTTQMGELLRRQGDLDQAGRFLDESLALIEQTNYLAGEPATQLVRAHLLRDLGEPDSAFQLAAIQVEPLQRNQQWRHLVDAYQLLSDTAYQRDDHEQALMWLEARVRTGERQAAHERERRLAYLQTVFELDQHEREIALLREQARVRALSSQAQSQQAYLRQLSFGALLLLLILLVLLLARAGRERRHFRNLSIRDSLTGLYNHTHFFAKTSKLVASGQAGQSLCLVLADIDHFKLINDRHGHLEGDQVLRRVAERLREAFPPPALIGRIGGEEFAIALPNCAIEQARDCVEQLRRAISRFRSESMDSSITMSFGLVADCDRRDIDSLRELADQALYRAKREGRDRLSVVNETGELHA
ncbi:MAG: diguanylate cyclase [Wenzhouxiangella sp.]|nr:MAG: diguanylate cyclase [Wenzhouxiangella sp.]